MAQQQWAALIRGLAQKYGVDPQAALAVASQEGLSGRVGDGGHAFGPFQLNDAGGVLTGRPGDHRSFAESPQGIEWAMQRIAGVAKGLHGQSAVDSIVRRFERPADPNGEVQRALGQYGKVTGGGASVPLPAPTSKGAQVTGGGGSSSMDALRQMLLGNAMAATQAFASGGQAQTMDTGQMLQMLSALRGQGTGASQAAAAPGGSQMTTGVSKQGQAHMVKFVGNTSGEQQPFLSALSGAVQAAGGDAVKVTSGYRNPQHNAAVGGVQGSLHTRGAAMDGYARIGGKWVPLGVALKAIAGKYGLRSGDQPGFYRGGPDPVHIDYGSGR